MKTNRTARWISSIRIIALCLALVTLGGIEFGVSQSLVSRIGQLSVPQTDSPQASAVNVADFIVAAR